MPDYVDVTFHFLALSVVMPTVPEIRTDEGSSALAHEITYEETSLDLIEELVKISDACFQEVRICFVSDFYIVLVRNQYVHDAAISSQKEVTLKHF